MIAAVGSSAGTWWRLGTAAYDLATMRRSATGTVSWARVLAPPLLLLGAGLGVAACGAESGDALDTLPPIRTTTTISTTTTTPDMRRIFYEVKSGDYLSDIARRYKVTVSSIMELNGLSTDVLQVGQELEIPNDLRLDDTLPPLDSSSTSGP